MPLHTPMERLDSAFPMLAILAMLAMNHSLHRRSLTMR